MCRQQQCHHVHTGAYCTQTPVHAYLVVCGDTSSVKMCTDVHACFPACGLHNNKPSCVGASLVLSCTETSPDGGCVD